MEANKLTAALLSTVDSFLTTLLLYISTPLPTYMSVIIWPIISATGFDDVETFTAEQQQIWIMGLRTIQLILFVILSLITVAQVVTGIMVFMILHYGRWTLLRIKILKVWFWTSFVYLNFLGTGLLLSNTDSGTALMMCILIILRFAVVNALPLVLACW